MAYNYQRNFRIHSARTVVIETRSRQSDFDFVATHLRRSSCYIIALFQCIRAPDSAHTAKQTRLLLPPIVDSNFVLHKKRNLL